MIETTLDASSITQHILQNPNWYHALTLDERLTSLKALMGSMPINSEGSVEAAERKFQRWHKQSPFSKGTYFADRLAMADMTEEDLRYLLGEPIEAVKARTTVPPAWLIALAQAFENSDAVADFQLPAMKEDTVLYRFLDTIKPLIKQGFDRLDAGIKILAQQHKSLPFHPTTIVELLYFNLPGLIFPPLMKTMVLELNIARLQEHLQGETPEERFHSFIQQLAEPKRILSLLELYPVLARLLITIINHWVNYGLEFLNHLCTDWNEICATFALENDPGILSEVKCGIGDAHRQGRSVIQLTFSSGFQLVYKPKSLSIDVHFQELLNWLNARGKHAAFRTIKLIDKRTYGWSEFIPTQSCTTVDEIARFYERQGGYLALLYTLHATDFHFENSIASGEHPVLIDLETLFHPYPQKYGASPDTDIGKEALELSVLRPGMLPMRIWSNASTEGVDISGLGGKGGQILPRPVSTWEEIGTDHMQLTSQPAMIPEQQNRPTLNGMYVDIVSYLDSFINGFTSIYHTLMNYREEVLTEILPGFAQDEIRLVLRATKAYGRLLQEAIHPTLLRDALARDRFFDHLWDIVEHHPYTSISRIIHAECRDLRSADIPLFTSYPNSPHLYTSQKQGIPNFLTETSIEAVTKHIQQLSEADLTHQIWVIQAAFATSMMGSEQAQWKPSLLAPVQTKVSHEQLLRAACSVGDRLCVLAHSNKQNSFWMNLTLQGEHQWIILPADMDFYSGMPGIIFFLAYLGAVTGEARYTTLAQSAFTTLRKQIEPFQQRQPVLGAFEGWGGWLYLYSHLGVLWQDPTLFTDAEELISSFFASIEHDEHMDILNGTAGCIRCLLNLYHVAPSPRILAAAIQCGDRLLACAQPMPRGVGWKTSLAKEQPLTGFSHGAAGIALSLLELAAVSGEIRFRHTACAAIEYERSVFSPELQNWPDFRDLEHKGTSSPLQDDAEDSLALPTMVTWCHGAPGIALGRLASLQYMDDEAMREEIALALKTTLKRGFGMNHSLCHGDLGNLEVLLTASQILQEPEYRLEVERLTAMIFNSIETHGWFTGVPLGAEVPGLMTGIAGIGYELLRLAEPEKVPSVLSLALPCIAESL